MRRLSLFFVLLLASTFSAAQLATVHTESASFENVASYQWVWPTTAGNQLRICVDGPVIGSADIWVFVDPVQGVKKRILPQAPWGKSADGSRMNFCFVVWAYLGTNPTTITMQFQQYGPGRVYNVRLDEFGTPFAVHP